ncbi:hypothetical protein SAMN03159341_101572 [Paenibacillus sp. 1_12]|uniref:hypothetical protein n=1 Tax=Paenibacillus sp. 1_12 TaxID=1566278 RepID=UPI0008F1A543|nr:hypothetical protein [Paenibacillus sp. 1_12]SFK78752.1 hypothetical protein SAMN03159341_101572 [Paenibacillus sp. 1_12]
MKTNQFILIVLFLMCTSFLTACGEGKHSGKSYDKDILNHLTYRYNEDFKIIDRVGENSQGYEKLLITPVNNPDIKFLAAMNYYAGIGDIMKSRKISHQFMEGLFFAYAPELYAKHLNITIPPDYFSHTLKYGDALEPTGATAPVPYVVTGVKEQDLIGLSKSFFEVLKGIYAHRPPKNINGLTGDFIKLPYTFEGSHQVNYVKLGLADAFPYDSYVIYNQLKQEYDKVSEKVKP